MDSILDSIKKMLGIEPEYTHFDQDIILNINTVIMILTQIGVGPLTGFVIKDKEDVWTDFIEDRIDLEAIKTYIYLKVRLLFDPPSNSFLLEAIERQIKELEWRLNSNAEQDEGGV